MVPFSFQNPPKSYKNQVPRGIQKLIDFGFDFLSIWAPFWEPSWNHVAHQNAPKTPQRRPKTPPRRPTKLSRRPQDTKTPSRGPKTPPRPPKIPPKTAENRPGSAQEPPEVLINWRGGTKAQSSICIFIYFIYCFFFYVYLHLSDYVYARSLCPEALCLKPSPFA